MPCQNGRALRGRWCDDLGPARPRRPASEICPGSPLAASYTALLHGRPEAGPPIGSGKQRSRGTSSVCHRVATPTSPPARGVSSGGPAIGLAPPMGRAARAPPSRPPTQRGGEKELGVQQLRAPFPPSLRAPSPPAQPSRRGPVSPCEGACAPSAPTGDGGGRSRRGAPRRTSWTITRCGQRPRRLDIPPGALYVQSVAVRPLRL